MCVRTDRRGSFFRDYVRRSFIDALTILSQGAMHFYKNAYILQMYK